MKKLEEIRARAEKAREGRRNFSGETEAESAMLALLAEQSSYDVPALLSALKAVQAGLSEQASGYRETAERLNRMVIDGDPDRDVDGAARYSHYASAWEAAHRMTVRAIQEALQ